MFLQYGLYSAFAGCIVYTVFGSCKDITIGPTALMSLMTHQQVVSRNSDYAVLLCFLSGILQFIMGSLKLGKNKYRIRLVCYRQYLPSILFEHYRDLHSIRLRHCIQRAMSSICIIESNKFNNFYSKPVTSI